MLMRLKSTHPSLQEIYPVTQSLIVAQICMLGIQVWISQNMLKLNPSKTEFMIIGNLTERKKVAYIFSNICRSAF